MIQPKGMPVGSARNISAGCPVRIFLGPGQYLSNEYPESQIRENGELSEKSGFSMITIVQKLP